MAPFLTYDYYKNWSSALFKFRLKKRYEVLLKFLQ